MTNVSTTVNISITMIAVELEVLLTTISPAMVPYKNKRGWDTIHAEGKQQDLGDCR